VAVILAIKVQHHAVRADQKAAQLAETNEDLIVKERLATANKQLADKRFVQALDAYRALVFDVQGKLMHRPGTQELRKAVLADAIQGLNTLVNDTSESQGAEHVTIWAHLTLGDVYLHLDGQSGKAAEECRRAFDLAQLRAAADPTDLQAHRDLAVSLEKLGAISLQTADNSGALRYYQRSLEIFKKLAAADGRAADRDLAISLENLGDVSVRTGDSKAALAYYRDSLEIVKKLAADDAESPPAQRDLSLALQKVADMELQSGDSQAALGHFRDSLRIDRKLAAADPTNSQAQRDLSVSLNKLGDASLQIDDSKSALTYYREGLEIARKLAAADSGDARAQRDLSVSLNKFGDMMLQAQDSEAGLGYFKESLEIRKKLAAADPLNFEAQTDLVIGDFKLNEASQLALDFDVARKYLQEAGGILATLESDGKLQGTKFARWPKVVQEETEFCEAARKAIASLDGALAAPTPLVPLLLNIRVQALAKMGDHVQAAATAGKLAQWQLIEASNLYNAACGYALCAAVIDKTPGHLDDAAKESRDRYLALALDLLAKARQQRFFETKENVNRLRTDKELNSLRELPEFKKFLHDLSAE
jgi:tetratricopeptide (TPR) repeat protein